jgi:hypothetical protein
LGFGIVVVFYHSDVTWDGSKGESSKNRGFLKHKVLGKVGVVSTWD